MSYHRLYPDRCAVESCERGHHARSYCNIHYARLKSHGDPNYVPPVRPTVCTVEGCTKSVETRDLCGAHYHRLHRYGNPTYRPPITDLSKVDKSLYGVWNSMRSRCQNPNTKSFSTYGALGISVCSRWQTSYLNFIEDIGSRPAKGMSIDRVDNKGNYSCGRCAECKLNEWPPNVKWSTKQEQVENSTSVRWITVNGETHTIAQWTRLNGYPQGMIADRLSAGWPEDEAVLTPKGGARRAV